MLKPPKTLDDALWGLASRAATQSPRLLWIVRFFDAIRLRPSHDFRLLRHRWPGIQYFRTADGYHPFHIAGLMPGDMIIIHGGVHLRLGHPA